MTQSQPYTISAFHEQLSHALRSRAVLRFEAGETEEAWKDMLASIRLFRFVTIDWARTNTMFGDDDVANRFLTPVDDVFDTLSQWTSEQLRRAIEDLESLPPWQDHQTILRILQFQMLDILSGAHDVFDFVERAGMSEDELEGAVMLQIFQHLAFDWNETARELNREVARYGELLERAEGNRLEEQFRMLRLGEPPRLPDMFVDEEELAEFITGVATKLDNPLSIFATSGRSRATGNLAGELTTYAAGETYRLQLMEESRTQALRLALALELFHQENGRYPNSLAELRLRPMVPDMQFEYESWGEGYRLRNKVFRLGE